MCQRRELFTRAIYIRLVCSLTRVAAAEARAKRAADVTVYTAALKRVLASMSPDAAHSKTNSIHCLSHTHTRTLSKERQRWLCVFLAPFIDVSYLFTLFITKKNK